MTKLKSQPNGIHLVDTCFCEWIAYRLAENRRDIRKALDDPLASKCSVWSPIEPAKGDTWCVESGGDPCDVCRASLCLNCRSDEVIRYEMESAMEKYYTATRYYISDLFRHADLSIFGQPIHLDRDARNEDYSNAVMASIYASLDVHFKALAKSLIRQFVAEEYGGDDYPRKANGPAFPGFEWVEK